MSDLDLESVLQKRLEALGNKTVELTDHEHLLAVELDALFLVVMSIMIFIMQCGFAFLEAGTVRDVIKSPLILFNISVSGPRTPSTSLSRTCWTPSSVRRPTGQLAGDWHMERMATSSVEDPNTSITQWTTRSTPSGSSR